MLCALCAFFVSSAVKKYQPHTDVAPFSILMEKDYYKILGVESSAGKKAIKEAYRQMAFTYHPDRNTDNPDAAEKMKAVNVAYAVLSDPKKRQEYDALRQRYGSSAHNHFRQSYSDQDIFNGSDINQLFEEISKSFGLRGFDDIFKDFYGQSYHTFEFKEDGSFGGGFFFSGGFGGGKGEKNKAGPQLFPTTGIGKLLQFFMKKATGIELPQTGADMNDAITLSQEHAQQGGPYAYFHKKRGRKLVVRIPPSVKHGQRIRLAGMGEDGKGGGQSGDLYLKVQIRKPLLQKLRNLIS